MQCRKNEKEVLAAGVTNSPACKETSHAYIFRFWLETINGQDLLPIKWLTVSHKQLVLEDLTLASYTCNLSYPWDLWAFLPLLQKLHVVSPCRAASFPATAGFFLAMMPGLLPVFYFWCLSGLPAAHFPVFILFFLLWLSVFQTLGFGWNLWSIPWYCISKSQGLSEWLPHDW